MQRVEDYVRGSLSSGNCSIERCARKLGTSVRTLQSQLSLDEVAALLGYSEPSSFGRVFKRWTGSTPQRFRALRAQ